MKNISIHPLSALLGAAFLAVPLALVSFQAQSWPRQVPILVSVQEMPDPHDMVVIREEGGPYTVPDEKLFVLTGVGNAVNHFQGEARLMANGISDISSDLVGTSGSGGGYWGSQTVFQVPLGFTYGPGIVLSIESNGAGRASGYLVDA